MFLGDSLTAGYGLARDQSVPSLIAERLTGMGLDYEVVNAGVSGDTSAGGLSRLDWSLDGNVRVLVVELGANDGLRGLPVDAMRDNLDAIIRRALDRGIRVLLTGMEAPPNYGQDYTNEYRAVFRDLAAKHGVAFVPFYLEGVAGNPTPEHRRRHPSEPGRRPDRRTDHLAGARTAPHRIRITGASMIDLQGVSKTVDSGGHPLTILHPLDYSIASGEFVAIVGPSGSGKSTLLGLLAGLDAPTTGSIVIDGVDITTLGEDALAALRGKKIGFVFQFFHLVPSLTAIENVQVPMEIAGRRDAFARAKQLIEEVGLTDRAHHYPSQLSGGEQQRVAIARALANDPPIVFADEPTGNLDSTTGRHIMDMLLAVRRTRRTTLVLVTHDADLAALADSRLVLRDGRRVETPVGAR